MPRGSPPARPGGSALLTASCVQGLLGRRAVSYQGQATALARRPALQPLPGQNPMPQASRASCSSPACAQGSAGGAVGQGWTPASPSEPRVLGYRADGGSSKGNMLTQGDAGVEGFEIDTPVTFPRSVHHKPCVVRPSLSRYTQCVCSCRAGVTAWRTQERRMDFFWGMQDLLQARSASESTSMSQQHFSVAVWWPRTLRMLLWMAWAYNSFCLCHTQQLATGQLKTNT